MLRSLLLAGSLLAWSQANPAVAQDYLIQIERTGYLNAPASDTKPRDKVLSSFQFVARAGAPFYGRTTSEGDTETVKGTLEGVEGDQVKLKLKYGFQRVNEESSVVTGEGTKIAGRSSVGSESDLTFRLGKTQLMGGSETRTERTVNDKKTSTMSRLAITIRITPYKPDEPTPEETEAADKENLQGIWSVVELVEDGQPVDAAVIRHQKFLFEGNRLIIKDQTGQRRKERYEYELDAAVVPHQIRLTGEPGTEGGKSATGIYERGADELRICLPDFESGTQPTQFESTAQSKRKLYKLKRS